ncbi:MAG: TetR/AcrR family transcriptional regulator [Roseiarcus sp.]|jgi:AcrR family transcriptional regulator
MVNKLAASGRRVALRDALEASAARIIGERGYQALRAREVAADVGCALGAIYGVFPDLDALILAVKQRTLDALDAEITRRLAAADASAAQSGASRQEQAERSLHSLARLYLAFASENPRLWRTVFEHRVPDSKVPDAYLARLDRVLTYVEHPLATLAPTMPRRERALFARALFSAVHGIVALGLDGKLGALSAQSLQWQVGALVHAAVLGLAAEPERPLIPAPPSPS